MVAGRINPTYRAEHMNTLTSHDDFQPVFVGKRHRTHGVIRRAVRPWDGYGYPTFTQASSAPPPPAPPHPPVSPFLLARDGGDRTRG